VPPDPATRARRRQSAAHSGKSLRSANEARANLADLPGAQGWAASAPSIWRTQCPRTAPPNVASPPVPRTNRRRLPTAPTMSVKERVL
jgi:hypothetical protein